MNAPLVSNLIRSHGVRREKVLQYLEAQLILAVEQMNVAHPMNSAQIAYTAETILERFPNESLQDFTISLRRLVQGFYGSNYHRMDCASVIACIEAVVEEKAMYLERDSARLKTAEANEGQSTYPTIDYDAYRKRLADQTTAREDERRKALLDDDKMAELKKSYKPTTPEQAEAHAKHIAYLQARYKHEHDMKNLSPDGAVVLVLFPSEAEWNKS